jgi:antirestriction protein ArdC
MAKFDLYQKVTDTIIEALEAGVAPWARPWSDRPGDAARNGVHVNRASNRPYSGVNVWLLEWDRWVRGFTSNEWLTFKQAKKLGGSVKKGERSSMIVFWKIIKKTETDPVTGEDKKVTIPLLRYYNVFNIEQCEGIAPREERTEVEEVADLPEDERVAMVEEFIAATGADIRTGGNRACYSPMHDTITLPEFGRFNCGGAYYATALHELVHWTGAKKRLDRLEWASFGSESYAKEELVAELGSAFLCTEFGIEAGLQHAEYIGNWIKALQNDKKLIFAASSRATKAATYLKEQAGTEEQERAA